MLFRTHAKSVKILQTLRAHIQPDAAWLLSTREKIIQSAEINSVRQVQRQGVVETVKLSARYYIPIRSSLFIGRPIMAIFAVIIVLLGGSIASVSAAERALPGDVLYPIKLATEQTRMILAKDSAEKLTLKAEFVGRRVQELQQIAASNVPEKQRRIQEAAAVVKRDLETVKIQLHDTAAGSDAGQIAQVAKMIDQKSTELASALDNMKSDTTADTRQAISDARSAAVNTGVRAVQILINTHNVPEVKAVMSDDELLKVIQNRVNGMENGMADAAKTLTATTTSGSDENGHVTVSVPAEISTSTQQQLRDARKVLNETNKLLQENKLDEVLDKLGQAATAVSNVERSIDGAVRAAQDATELRDEVASSTTQASAESSSTTSTTSPSTSSTPGP